ncbi:calcium-binding protein [Halomonas vilamensis]|uniref:Calcium-binding protein n=1 Tax=Vreelandella vilamensis TaxID=531309 RepID=A0ABU1H7U9_9GAMM|nr:calcium-binding protein [Halomonas vilamensis]MDR5900375.1 calcium-binding protein [Halomonas vilamensis]
MANINWILLDTTPDTLSIPAGSDVKVLGNTSGKTVNLESGASVVGLDAGTADVNLAGIASTDVTVVRNGTTLEIRNANGELLVSVAAGTGKTTELSFTDGSATLAVSGTDINFGGQTLGDDVEVAGSDITVTGEGSGDTGDTDAGQTFSLTASADSINEGASNTFTVTASQPVAEETTVTFELKIDGESASLEDFNAGELNPVTVTIPAGETEATFDVVSITADGSEASETYRVEAVVNGETLSQQITLLDVVEGAGQTFDLTTSVDDISGTGDNDTFTGTRGNGAGPYTFNSGDILDGLGGTDTLNITTGAEASTPPDTLWSDISNFEKVIFKSLGNGAQSITTGANFQAAFGAQGVDVTAQTLLGAIDLTMASFTGTADITTITEGAGAHSIVTGSGVSTVNATGISAGAQTINGVGLTTVTATINDAGNQVIGTTQGDNLVSVKATILAAGDQTIASTSDSNVTVVASAAAGAQTVTTAGGNDSITTTGAAGNAGTISTGAGNDTIVAGFTTDAITGGTGSDTMTGGGGVDTFAFGNDGSVIGTDRDIITDFNTSGADILSFSGEAIVLTADSSALVAGANVQTSSGGLITFSAADDTLADKIIAIQADAELDAAGSVGMFVDSGNTYVYHAGEFAGDADDQLIQLTGIDTLTTLTGGATLTIG